MEKGKQYKLRPGDKLPISMETYTQWLKSHPSAVTSGRELIFSGAMPTSTSDYILLFIDSGYYSQIPLLYNISRKLPNDIQILGITLRIFEIRDHDNYLVIEVP